MVSHRGVIPLTVAILIKKFLNKKKLEVKERMNDYYFTDGSLDDRAEGCYVIIVLIIIAIILTTSNMASIIQDIVFLEKTIIEFIAPYIK